MSPSPPSSLPPFPPSPLLPSSLALSLSLNLNLNLNLSLSLSLFLSLFNCFFLLYIYVHACIDSFIIFLSIYMSHICIHVTVDTHSVVCSNATQSHHALQRDTMSCAAYRLRQLRRVNAASLALDASDSLLRPVAGAGKSKRRMSLRSDLLRCLLFAGSFVGLGLEG